MASILITGATNGLGLALAEELAEARHQLLLHGRLDVLVNNAGAASPGTAPSEACQRTDTSSGRR
ncbi:hypothetical protein [Streptomyces sp. CS159]|uniref:hypothetical protein n=1 Tax=Streptomyces sp. CS159 TaxID=1982762 RepID=UPI00117EDE5C|nr:hypothetical protein [Streptomyces sp. CS159]